MKRIKKKNSIREEVPFAPVASKVKIDISPKTFARSDAFSKMMDRAHRLAMRRNDRFASCIRERD